MVSGELTLVDSRLTNGVIDDKSICLTPLALNVSEIKEGSTSLYIVTVRGMRGFSAAALLVNLISYELNVLVGSTGISNHQELEP